MIQKKERQSEKQTEPFLVDQARELGGIALKYHNGATTGYPDRLVLLPGGVAFWVEVKSEGRKPRKLQLDRMAELRALGQRVYVCDTKESVTAALRAETRREEAL